MSRTFANYVVSGAGMTNVNGRYVPSGNNEFTLENGKFVIWNNGIYWFIRSNEDFTNPYKTTDNPATPDLGTWVKGQISGIDPPPTVVAGTPLPANPDILVSGAGSDLVNGTYKHTAFENGKPMYTKGSDQYRIASYGAWQIFAPYTHPEYGDIDAPYYQEKQSESGSPATPDLVAEWEIWTAEGEPPTGVNPPPNVTEYTPDPPHDIAVDPLTATAGLTEPTLTQTHKLSATALGATAGISEPTLEQTHELKANSLTAQATLTGMSRTLATYVVSGAGESQVNGTYIESGTDVFSYRDYTLRKESDGKWRILYYESERYITTDTPATPDLGTWVKGQYEYATDPPPTVVAGTPIPANPNILVSGAGSDLVNGTYEHTAFENGKPIYTKAGTSCSIGYIWGYWFISDSWDLASASGYMGAENGDTPDLVTTWEPFGDGELPVPTVEEAPDIEPTLTQTHIINVEPLSANAGLTEPTLTQTHALGTVELVASAGLTEPTLTQTHIINVDPLGMVANLTDIDFAQTHVIDIEPLWAQIELSDLTLAQYIRTPTPDCRRLTIHAEDRTLTIPREDRTLKIKCCE